MGNGSTKEIDSSNQHSKILHCSLLHPDSIDDTHPADNKKNRAPKNVLRFAGLLGKSFKHTLPNGGAFHGDFHLMGSNP